MQADNLRPEDLKRMEEAFGEIKKGNPEAILNSFITHDFKKKDCLFKEKCNKVK